MMGHDPFDDSVRELQAVIVSAKGVREKISKSGAVSAEQIAELGSLCDEADELVELLRTTLSVIESKGGRVQGKVFSANEVVERQGTLRQLQGDAADLREMHRTLTAQQTRLRQQVAQQQAAGGQGKLTDEYVLMQETQQREETAQQDEALDRLTFGLRELRETGINIHDELDRQEVLLDEVDRDISGVQVRLRSANEKVNKLLESMSDKGKICTIIILILVLVFLCFLVF